MSQIIGYSSTDRGTVSSDTRNETFIGSINDPAAQSRFSIFLFNTETNKIEVPGSDIQLDPANKRHNAEFIFSVPPKSFEITEPFASRVVPTQNSGMYVESHGIVVRSIRIQGTTGFRPNKLQSSNGEPAIIAQQGQLLASAPNRVGLKVSENEITGHDDMIFLRNIFRYYSDQVKINTRRLVMVIRNNRDDDYWIVEPEDLKVNRASSSPFTYEYSINLKALARYKYLLTTEPKDPLKILRDVRRTASRLQQYNNILVNNILFLGTQVNRAKALGYSALNQTIGKATDVVRGVNTVKTNAQDVPKLRQASIDYLDELNNAIQQLRQNSPAGDPLVRNLQRLYILTCHILGEQIVRDSIASNLTNTQNRINTAYSGSSVPGTGAKTIAQGTVNINENIRDISRRLTGNSDNWRQLVEINGLKPPYISSDPALTNGVLAPGDAILYPSNNSRDVDPANIASASTNSPLENEDTGYFAGPVVQSYGRDLRLKSSMAGNQNYAADLDVNQNGDISTIAGVQNVEQGILLKFSTERGELPKHSQFGAQYTIGTRMTNTSFNDFRITVIDTISSDPRIKEINSLKFNTVGDIVAVQATLTLSDARNQLTTDFALRRF